MDELFGSENFVADLIWLNKEGGGGSDSKLFRIKHEHILCYSSDLTNLTLNGVEISNLERYTMSDEYEAIRGKFYLQKLGMGSIQYSQSLDYPIQAPDGLDIYPSTKDQRACWRWSKQKLDWGFKNGFIVIKKDSSDTWQVYTKQYLKCDNEGNFIERTNRPMAVIETFSSTQAGKYLKTMGLVNFS
jgi:adenine-specific DNA-methyltransferase